MRTTAMRFVVAALTVVALVASIAVSSAQDTGTTTTATPTTTTAPEPAKPKCKKPWEHNRYARYVLQFGHSGPNYWAKAPTEKRLRKLGNMRACVKKAGNTVAYKKMRHYWEHRQKRWAFHHHIDAITVYGAWAVPPYIVMRESHGNICAKNPGSTAGGYYQFIDSTWYSVGGRGDWGGGYWSGYKHPAACAPAWMQHEAAANAWNGGNNSHWTLTR